MTGYINHLIDLTKKDSSLQVDFGHNVRYIMKGIGTNSFHLDLGDSLHMSNVLFLPGLNKNHLSILELEDKCYSVSFVDGKVLVWPKGRVFFKDSKIIPMYSSLGDCFV